MRARRGEAEARTRRGSNSGYAPRKTVMTRAARAAGPPDFGTTSSAPWTCRASLCARDRLARPEDDRDVDPLHGRLDHVHEVLAAHLPPELRSRGRSRRASPRRCRRGPRCLRRTRGPGRRRAAARPPPPARVCGSSSTSSTDLRRRARIGARPGAPASPKAGAGDTGPSPGKCLRRPRPREAPAQPLERLEDGALASREAPAPRPGSGRGWRRPPTSARISTPPCGRWPCAPCPSGTPEAAGFRAARREWAAWSRTAARSAGFEPATRATRGWAGRRRGVREGRRGLRPPLGAQGGRLRHEARAAPGARHDAVRVGERVRWGSCSAGSSCRVALGSSGRRPGTRV